MQKDWALSVRNEGNFRIVLAMSILCCLLPQLAAQNPSRDEQTSHIHGTVVNSVTHEPIGRALVASPDSRFAAMTDDQGHFEFVLSSAEQAAAKSVQSNESPSPNQPPALTARKPGFLEDNEGQSIAVAPGQKEVVLTLTPEALIVGHVVLPDDAERIIVDIYRRDVQEGAARWMMSGTTIARSSGEFRFAGLAAGKYKLLTREYLDRDSLTLFPSAPLYGYPPVYFPSAPDLVTAATIDLPAGGTFQASIAPIRQTYYRVSVPVADAQPQTVLQANVSVQGRPSPGFSVAYNQQERKIEGFLPNGIYTIDAFTYDYPLAKSGTMNIMVKGAAVQAPRITLLPRASIPVNVKEEFTSAADSGPARPVFGNGRVYRTKGPRGYLNLTLWSADENGPAEAAPLGPPSGPEDESLVVPNVQPGSYWVQIDSSRGFAASATSGGTDLLHHPLSVGPGGAMLPIEITMRDDWAHFTAKIEPAHDEASAVESGGSAIPVWICLVPLPDSAGKFQEISMLSSVDSGDVPVAPGEYRVLAFGHAHPELEYRNADVMHAYDSKGQVIHLIAGQKEQTTLSLISAGELR
jgi:hypothetical protein